MKNKLVKAVSEISDGNMSWVWGEKEVVKKNREKFFKKNGLKYENCVFAYLTSGTDLKVVGKNDLGQEFKCDALVTAEPDIGLAMCAADCLPVALTDKDRGVLAMVHLGWKGVDGRLAQKTVKQMAKLGAIEKNIEVWIGPGVRSETYIKYGDKFTEFQKMLNPENLEEWKEFVLPQTTLGWYGIDLVGYVIKQLTEVGVVNKNIQVSEIDTIKDINYFSHYRVGQTGEIEGRFATAVVLRQDMV